MIDFQSVATATVNANVASNYQTVTGLDIDASISIIGGAYQIENLDFTNQASRINNNQRVRVRLMSGRAGEVKKATLTIGTKHARFIVTTSQNIDTTPAPFSFTATTNVERNTLMISEPIMVRDINNATAISIVNGQYLVNGIISTQDRVNLNDTIAVQHVSANEFSRSVSTILTIGGVSASFISTTRAQDFTPDNFIDFESVSIASPNATITSNIQTITGLDSDANISIVGGEYQIESLDFTNQAGRINNNQRVKVRLISGESGEVKTVTLTIGTKHARFVVTTSQTIDTTPAPFSFDATSNVEPDTLITSNEITVSDINHATTISIINGVYFVNDILSAQQTVNNGDVIKVQHRSVNSFNSTTTSILMIGDISSTFTSTTRQQDIDPDQPVFNSVNNATPNAMITSNAQPITGIDITTTTIKIEGGSYIIDGGTPTARDATIGLNSQVVISLVTTISFNANHVATLTIGTVEAIFSVTTGVSLDVDGDRDVDANDGVLIHRALNQQNSVIRNITMPKPAGVIKTPYTSDQVQSIVTSASTTYNVDNSDKVDDLDGLLIRRYLSNAGNITANTGIAAASETMIIDNINRIK